MSAALSAARQKQPEIEHLIQVAGSGDAATVEAQLAAGVDVNSATENGMTTLMSAAANGHLQIVSLLLERGANVNVKRNDGLTALALAAFFGHQRIVRELLCNGADIEAKSRFGTSPEMWARSRGFTTITKLLQDACSEEAIQGSGNPGESEQVHSDACKSAVTEEVEPLSQMSHLRSNESECFELSDATLEESAVNVWLLDYDDYGPGKPIDTRPPSVPDEAIHLAVSESTVINAGRSATEEICALTNSVHTQTVPCHHDLPSVNRSLLFLAKITSDWRRLTLAPLVVMLCGGIATAFFLEIIGARNMHQFYPRANNAVTLSQEPTTLPPSTSTTRPFSEPFRSVVENRTKSAERVATRLSAKATMFRVTSFEKRARWNSREISAKVRATKRRAAGSADIAARNTSVQSALVAAKTEGGVKANEFKPAPLNFEAPRPRSAPKEDSTAAASDSGSGITSGSGHPKAKVIRWP